MINKQKGFTLVELLISISILAIFSFALAFLYHNGMQNYRKSNNLITLQNQSRNIREILEEDIRNSQGVFDKKEDYKGFSIDNKISYYQNQEKLIRKEEKKEILTQNLEKFNFEIFKNESNENIKIEKIVLRDNQNFQYNFSVSTSPRKQYVVFNQEFQQEEPENLKIYFQKPEWANDGPNISINSEEIGNIEDEQMNNEENNWFKYKVDTEYPKKEFAFQIVFFEDGVAKTLYEGEDFENWVVKSTETGEVWIETKDEFFNWDGNDYYLDESAYSNN